MSRRAPLTAALVVIGAAVLSSCAPSEPPAPTLTGVPTEAASSDAASTDARTTGDAVPVSRPVHLTFPAAEIDGGVEEYTADQAVADGGINPPRLETIAWYSGVPDPMPGTNATNTVYIFGHTWIEDAAFNGLSVVKAGDLAELRTETGVLQYEVEDVISMDKDDFTSDPTVAAVVPGRLVLVTCHRPDGWPADELAPRNTAVILRLTGSAQS